MSALSARIRPITELQHSSSAKLLGLVGFADFVHVSVEKYSRGMRQRLTLALALLHRPSLLVLDEPAAGLIPKVMAELWEILRGPRAEWNLTRLMATTCWRPRPFRTGSRS